MSMYTDVPLLPWEYVLAAILSISMLWLVLRATRKAERRRSATLRSPVSDQPPTGDAPLRPPPAQAREATASAPVAKDDR